MSYEDIETANKMISDLKDSLRLNANAVMSLTAKLYAMHDAITALMDNSEEFEFDDGLGKGAPQCYWDELYEAINEAAPPLREGWVMVPREPSVKMLQVLAREWHPDKYAYMADRYKAMIAASEEQDNG